MSIFDTQLRIGTPHTNRVLLMGQIQEAPSTQHDEHGTATVVRLRIAGDPFDIVEPSPEGCSTLFSTPRHTATLRRAACKTQKHADYGNADDQHAQVSILVRGRAALWCATCLHDGMVVHVEAHLRSLGTTASGACLTYLEAEQIQVVEGIPRQDSSTRPGTLPPTSTLCSRSPHLPYSMSTN